MSDLFYIRPAMPEIPAYLFGLRGACQEGVAQRRSPAVAIAGAVLTAALGVALVPPAGAAAARASASASTGANATTNVAGSAGAGIGDALAGLPASSLRSVLSRAVAMLPAGTVVALPAAVLPQLSSRVQISPAVLSALPIDKLLIVVAPALAALPTATLLGLVGAVVSALPPASVLGLIGPVEGGGAGVVAGAGTGAALQPTTTTRANTTTTLASVVIAAAPVSVTASGAAGARCAAARSDVEAAELLLPAQFEYRCPGSTELFAGDRQHWGTTCSMASLCRGHSYIAINPGLIGRSEARLRYVVAHETCHALDVAARRPLDESAADACAAAHGFPRV